MDRCGYCIYIDTLCEGAVPLVRGGDGKPCVFLTRVEAEREIVDHLITRLEEFMAGEREFEDAVTFDEYIVEVNILPDGTVFDEEERCFEARIVQSDADGKQTK